jgi:hypothetical protein
VAGRFETDWFDCNVPDWLAKRLGNIELAIRKLAEEAKRDGK